MREACGQRRRGRLGISLLILVCVPGLLGAERPKGLGDVEDVRTWSHADFTRVVVQLTRAVDLEGDEVVRLAADRGAKRPERLYVDLPRIWVGRRYLDGVTVGDGLLEGVRLGQNTLTTARMVIDLERYGHHRLFTLRNPHRVVVDVYGSNGSNGSEIRTASKTRTPGAEASANPTRRLSMGSRPLRTVVIDPGHGGKDPGAIGLGGVREKDVNLRLSRLLARRLRARGFRVVMTREDDRYIDLEERTVIAESERGDIFVSIHANASRRRSLRGIEIYYLDEDHKRHNREVAARENGVEPSELDPLQRTISRLRVSEASVHSQTLANIVHDDVTKGLKQTYRGVPDLGVKRGPFYVLFMSNMPALLVESGFLTNKQDAKLLRSEAYLDTLAAQIAAGLGHYRNHGRQLAAETASAESKLPPVGAEK